jgi:hypothetical protein
MKETGIVNTRSAVSPSCGHWAGSVARLNGRETSKSSPHLGHRKSYSGTWLSLLVHS